MCNHGCGYNAQQRLLLQCATTVVVTMCNNGFVTSDARLDSGGRFSYALICSHMLSYAIICSHMLSYALICSHMFSYALICSHMLSYAFICYHMLSYALICSHIVSASRHPPTPISAVSWVLWRLLSAPSCKTAVETNEISTFLRAFGVLGVSLVVPLGPLWGRLGSPEVPWGIPWGP
jgi:hypothetical protein